MRPKMTHFPGVWGPKGCLFDVSCVGPLLKNVLPALRRDHDLCMVVTRWSWDIFGRRCNTHISTIVHADLFRVAPLDCLQASPGMSAKHILRTYHRGSMYLSVALE